MIFALWVWVSLALKRSLPKSDLQFPFKNSYLAKYLILKGFYLEVRDADGSKRSP